MGMLIFLLIVIFIIYSLWRVFEKASQPGWACLIPIYNIYIMLKIGNKPGWWLILLFIPLVNLVISILMSIGIAKAFGKGEGFGLGIAFLGFIFFPILAFGDAEYKALEND